MVCVQLGQQMPKVAVMQPASQASREVEDSRLVAWVHRALRRSQSKLAREAADRADERPSISLQARTSLPPPLNTLLGGLACLPKPVNTIKCCGVRDG